MGGFVASVTAGYVAAASIFLFLFSEAEKALLNTLSFILALSCRLLLLRVPTGCWESLSRPPGEGKAVSAPSAGGAHCRNEGSQSSLCY